MTEEARIDEFADVDDARMRLADVGYLADSRLATMVFLQSRLGKPVLLEGPAGVGEDPAGDQPGPRDRSPAAPARQRERPAHTGVRGAEPPGARDRVAHPGAEVLVAAGSVRPSALCGVLRPRAGGAEPARARPRRGSAGARAVREATVPIDPFVDVVDGRYVDELVVVQPISASWPARGRGSVRTPHFDIAPPTDGWSSPTRWCGPASATTSPGSSSTSCSLPGGCGVRRCSSASSPASSSRAHRGRSLGGSCSTATRSSVSTNWSGPPTGEVGGHGTIDGLCPVYAHAEALTLPGSVLELGCCSGSCPCGWPGPATA